MLQRGRHDRTAMADILNPVNGYRGMLELQGIKPKDHRKSNMQLIRQKEEERKKEDEIVHKEPFKMRKFLNVPSRIKDTLSDRPQTAQSRKPADKHVAFGRLT